jgi:glycosyltransferase involved in cell wall biosynthesis
VLVTHGIEIWRPLSWVKRYPLGKCSQIVTLSRFVAKSLDTAQGQHHAPVTVVPAGLSDEWSAGIVARQDSTSRGTVLTVGRLWSTDQQKGVDRVIQAFPQVLGRVPEARLWIVGDGSDRPRLELLASRLSIAHRVEFLGAVDDASLKQAYANSDVFALPSIQEGFGLVYLEAMAHGLPCIVAAGTAGAEVVESGVTGLGVPPDDVDQVAKAITSLLTNRARWSLMSRAASACFQERYREAAFAGRIRRVLLGTG